jgi:hypothetical protein
MRQGARGLATFLAVLPAAWWMAATIPTFFYDGVFHDIRFYRIYHLSWFFATWVSTRAGRWYGQAHATALQDSIVAIVCALVATLVPSRWAFWQSSRGLFLAVVALSLALPWDQIVSNADRPDYFAVATYALLSGYGAAALLGVFWRGSSGMRRALLATSLALALLLVSMRLEPWDWLFSGPLIASVALLGQGIVHDHFGFIRVE